MQGDYYYDSVINDLCLSLLPSNARAVTDEFRNSVDECLHRMEADNQWESLLFHSNGSNMIVRILNRLSRGPFLNDWIVRSRMIRYTYVMGMQYLEKYSPNIQMKTQYTLNLIHAVHKIVEHLQSQYVVSYGYVHRDIGQILTLNDAAISSDPSNVEYSIDHPREDFEYNDAVEFIHNVNHLMHALNLALNVSIEHNPDRWFDLDADQNQERSSFSGLERIFLNAYCDDLNNYIPNAVRRAQRIIRRWEKKRLREQRQEAESWVGQA